EGAMNTRDDPGIPQRLTYLAIIVGLLLVIVGVGMMTFGPSLMVSDPRFKVWVLVICIGFGIVLVAFGTRVAGTWRSWSVVGSGAMAIVLFSILEGATRWTPSPSYVKGTLHGTAQMYSVSIIAAVPLLVGKHLGEDYHFAAFPNDLNSPTFYVN